MEGWDDVRRTGRTRVIRHTGVVPRADEILMTTPPRDIYQDEGYEGDIPCLTPDGRQDWFAIHPLAFPEKYHVSVKGRPNDLAFLQANIPGPTFLEVPRQQDILDHLASGRYRILGISAYTWTLPWALRMAERAKAEFGIEETWLGNYAIMTAEPRVEQVFDRLFAGYAEDLVRNVLGMPALGTRGLVHPDLTVRSTYLGREVKIGHLIYERGCTQRCTFCADPVFQPGGEAEMAMERIAEVIKFYKESGCASVHLVNQDVRPFRHLGMEIIKLLKQYRMPFTMMTSLLALMGKGEDGLRWLREMGLTMVQPGIESLDDTNLKSSLKNSNVERIERTVELLHSVGIRFACTYMICMENDTVESIRRAKHRLGELGPIYSYNGIIQPMPGTPFYADLLRRGLIADWDWRKWTGGYLVWKHPTVSADQARDLLFELDEAVNTPLHNPVLQREWMRIERMQQRLGRRVDARGRVVFDPHRIEQGGAPSTEAAATAAGPVGARGA